LFASKKYYLCFIPEFPGRKIFDSTLMERKNFTRAGVAEKMHPSVFKQNAAVL